MNQFLNYDVNQGLSIDTYRKAGFTVGDMGDVVIALQSNNENICCALEGAVDALCDGDYLKGIAVTQDAIEEVYDFIQENSEKEF